MYELEIIVLVSRKHYMENIGHNWTADAEGLLKTLANDIADEIKAERCPWAFDKEAFLSACGIESKDATSEVKDRAEYEQVCPFTFAHTQEFCGYPQCRS